MNAEALNGVLFGMTEKEIGRLLGDRLDELAATLPPAELKSVGQELYNVFAEAKEARLNDRDRADFELMLAATRDGSPSALDLFFDLRRGLTWEKSRELAFMIYGPNCKGTMTSNGGN